MPSAQTEYEDIPHMRSEDYPANGPKNSSYSNFDYREAYGNNPFAAPARELQSAITPLVRPCEPAGTPFRIVRGPTVRLRGKAILVSRA